MAAEISQVTIDPALAEVEAGKEEEGFGLLEQSIDTFASAQSITPRVTTESHGSSRKDPDKRIKDASSEESTRSGSPMVATLRPPTGSSPLPSPVGSPMVRYTGPLKTLQSPVSKDPRSTTRRERKKHPAQGLLTALDRPKAKLHERGRAGFVGQGLGIVSSPTPKYSAGGSAKQVLAKILAES